MYIRVDDGSQAKILNLEPYRGKRVRIFGWVHRLRSQKDIIFIVLRDGTGYLQAILSGVPVRDFFLLLCTAQASTHAQIGSNVCSANIDPRVYRRAGRHPAADA